MPSFPSVPSEIKGIAHYMKVAEEHDERDPVVSYWARMYACQTAMKIMEGKTKPPEVTKLLIAIMDWLESLKKGNPNLEGVHSDVCAQALIENYALQLFNYADQQDRAENYGKNVVKAFYTCGILMDILSQFGTPSDEIREKKKYAKWKAAYIHNCLKNGELPRPGSSAFGENDNLIKIGDNDETNTTPSTSNAEPSIPPEKSPTTPSTPAPTFPSPASPAETPTPASAGGWPDLPSVPSFDPTNPQPAPTFPNTAPVSAVTPTTNLTPDQMEKAQKYCKWAGSALNYDDVKNAIENLQKALHLLQYGEEK
ncbi:vacuolar protein sorting-associated protein VTA1 homolog [Agrilus planipennis]|uniref:Vacuolar protein sorting-associated protein VTA1 homolog n=1 Tax=Agrilus planipennis TaxID=224129 RepID=A0A1W4WHH9_AGRPL|nr:vacuolar protein sorting-associated protein VTA1 homolog [Agrilus planipennis]